MSGIIETNMMPAHIVPQSILDIEFKLFGSLTVRQFSFIAGSVAIGLICYFTFGAVPIIQWILIIIDLFVGLLLAFFRPYDRPFDEWLTNYLLATFTNQRSTFHKSRKTVDFLNDLGDYDPEITNSRKSISVNISRNNIDLDKLLNSNEDKNDDDLEYRISINDFYKMFDDTDSAKIPVYDNQIVTLPKRSTNNNTTLQKILLKVKNVVSPNNSNINPAFMRYNSLTVDPTESKRIREEKLRVIEQQRNINNN